MSIDRFSLFRIISFSLAGGDVVQTIPDTYRLYRKQWVNRNLSLVCFFYAMARYMSILSLISNGIGFFGTDFTPASCRRFYMLPNITAMLAGMAVQVLVFIRTFAISGRSKLVFFGLGGLLLLCFPVQVFGITYHRDPYLSKGSCKGKVLRQGEPDWNIVYYSAHMVFDLSACVTATTYLILISRVQGTFNSSKFLLRVLRNGLLYTVVVFLANLWVVMEFAGVFSSGAASTLPLAVVMIAAQHLILSTQRVTVDEPSITDDLRPSRTQSARGSTGRSSGRGTGPSRFFSAQNTQPNPEIQPDVFMLSGNQKTHYEPAQRDSHFDLEAASIAKGRSGAV